MSKSAFVVVPMPIFNGRNKCVSVNNNGSCGNNSSVDLTTGVIKSVNCSDDNNTSVDFKSTSCRKLNLGR